MAVDHDGLIGMLTRLKLTAIRDQQLRRHRGSRRGW
jgi:hypothetical protein